MRAFPLKPAGGKRQTRTRLPDSSQMAMLQMAMLKVLCLRPASWVAGEQRKVVVRADTLIAVPA